MKALILAAGYGTRLAAVVKDTPKPLILVNSKPLIDHIIFQLKAEPSLTEIVVVSNNKFYEQFQQWARTHKDIKVRVVNDGTNTPEERLGSVGDIHFVWQHENELDDWLVIGGDNLFDQNPVEFMKFAHERSPAITIGVYDIHDKAAATKFGVIGLDPQKRVVSFEEKPAQPKYSLITMCFYYFPKSSIVYLSEYLSQSKALDAAGSYIQWLSQKKNVYGFQFSGKWYDIGSVESLYEAQKFFK
jgi:glucose-1-phosphate thymidylyltransferase